MKITQSYDPSKIILLINGIPIAGFSEDSMVKISTKEDRHTVKSGVDGKTAVFVKSHDTQATITFTLDESSISNLALGALISSGNTVSVAVTNLNTARGFFASQAMFQKMPDVDWGKNAPDVEYTLITPEINPVGLGV